MDPVPDPLLLRKSGSAGNGTRDIHDEVAMRRQLVKYENHQIVEMCEQELSKKQLKLNDLRTQWFSRREGLNDKR